MTPEFRRAAQEMIDVLLLENRSLEALDFPAATRFLTRKRAAVAALDVARTNWDGPADAGTREVVGILRDAAELNRTVLERAVAVQGRVIRVLGQAARAAAPAGRYGSGGGIAVDRGCHGYAFSGRA